MKEGKLIVYPKRWKRTLHHLLATSTDIPCFSNCIRTKRQPSKKPKSLEEKLRTLEKKFDIKLKEMQETLNKIMTLLDIRE
jgi:hypothetical protein